MPSRRTFSRSTGLLALLACAAAAAWTAEAAAQDSNTDASTTANLNVFISPSGKPSRADPGKPYPVVDWFNAADKDHDGKLTKAEFRADADAFFHELDVNKDGAIDQREVAYYERVTAPEIIQSFTPDQGLPADDNAPKQKDPPNGGGWYGLLGEPEPVAAADTNFDNVITYAEFMQATDERWKLLDPDKKGYITLDSLPQTPIQAKLAQQQPRHKRR
jgi:Ca2+-binding EF-hand superfamily protein